MLEVPRGVYRISDAECGSGEALMLCDSENFTLRGPGVEIICELEGSHARVLGNKNLTLEGGHGLSAHSCGCPPHLQERWGQPRSICILRLLKADITHEAMPTALRALPACSSAATMRLLYGCQWGDCQALMLGLACQERQTIH